MKRTKKTSSVFVWGSLAAVAVSGLAGYMSAPKTMTTSGHNSTIQLPSGRILHFVRRPQNGKWEVIGSGNQILAAGPLYTKFVGNKVYRASFNIQRWEANRNHLVLQLNEGVKGFAQPVKLFLYALNPDKTRQKPHRLVSGANWGGEHFTWNLNGNEVHAIQQSVNAKGKTETIFDKNVKI